METIIDGLLYGKIQEVMSKSTPSSHKSICEVSDNYDKLIAMLTKQQVEALKLFTASLEEHNLIATENAFKQGFKYGAKIIMEVLEDVHS